jgi:hypothetical protein
VKDLLGGDDDEDEEDDLLVPEWKIVLIFVGGYGKCVNPITIWSWPRQTLGHIIKVIA